MDAKTAYDLVAKYLSEHFEVPKDKIKPEANMFVDLELDSIDALDMIGLLESEYQFEVKEDELRQMRTVQDLVNYLVKYIKD